MFGSAPFNVCHEPRIESSTGGGWMVQHPSNGAILGYYGTREEAVAAVALHEAAPDLLDAARRALDVLGPMPVLDGDPGGISRVKADLRAVIARIGGQS